MLFNFEKHTPVAYSENGLCQVFAHDGGAIRDSREFWHKSSCSNDTIESACVEVSLAHDALVRDSKATGGDALVFSIQAWRAFVVSVA